MDNVRACSLKDLALQEWVLMPYKRTRLTLRMILHLWKDEGVVSIQSNERCATVQNRTGVQELYRGREGAWRITGSPFADKNRAVEAKAW